MLFPNLNDLRYFVEIAQAGTFTQASQRLGLAQPSLTLAIQRLESTLGTKVLQRSKKGVHLTPAGKTLLSQSRKLIDEWQAIQTKTLASHSEVKGRFRIGCHPSVALYTFPQILTQLLNENSSLELTFVHDLSRKILDDIVSVKVDIGIVVNPQPHPDLVIQKLCLDEVCFWVSEKSRAEDRTVLISDPELSQTQQLIKKAQKSGLTFERQTYTSNLEFIAELTSESAGVGILPTRVAKRKSNLKKLKSSPAVIDEICMVYRADLRPVRSIKVIAAKIQQALVLT